MNPVYVARRVYREFAATGFGDMLKDTPRYHRFIPDGFSTEQWERLIGPDGNNLHHMRQSIAVAAWFVDTENNIKPGTFSYKEAQELTVTAAMHDQGEAVVGDIEYGRKSRNQREKEARTLVEYEASFVPKLGGMILTVYRRGQDIAFGDKMQKMPGAFKTVELMGFMNNTLSSLQQIRRLEHAALGDRYMTLLGIDSDEDREAAIVALKRLTTEVLGSGVVGDLIECGKRFPSAQNYLQLHASQISKGMEGVLEETFGWYDKEDPGATSGERRRRLEKFHQQKNLWRVWIADHSSAEVPFIAR
ncbi:hypothetical protein IPL85_03945 [Candidatus Saccharibacteria bacterium]|nr:MAG: hypothetical protein IPL85_03945 [Candidatus Saccharibacteria bacterium]